MTKSYLSILLICVGLNLLNANTISSKDFLEKVRYPAQKEQTKAELSGTFQFKKGDEKIQNHHIDFNVELKSPNMDSELILDKKEHYKLSRQGDKITIDELKEGVLKSSMISPLDLALGFVFYNFIREDAESTVSAIPCRVMILEAPDKSEIVKAYMAKNYAFTLKAEFFKSLKSLDDNDMFKTLEIRSFKQQNNIYYAELINIYGKNWRSRIHFTDAKLTILGH